MTTLSTETFIQNPPLQQIPKLIKLGMAEETTEQKAKPEKKPLTKVEREAYPISLSKLPNLDQITPQKLQEILGWPSLKKLTWLTVSKNENYTISYLQKKKRNGKIKMRKIHNPSRFIRLAQYKILTRLLEPIPIPPYIHGFEIGKSIPNMAREHVGKEIVISIDIENFFDSIKQYMVKSLFQTVGFKDPTTATILSELCTYKYYVPQGSLTAPKISNLITAGTFGPVLKKYCDERNLTLTVYADDVTISYNNVPESTLEERKARTSEIIQFVYSTLERFKFKANRDKTKVMTKSKRQWVCGAVVNEKVNMQKNERAKLRAIAHNCRVNGVEAESAKIDMKTENFIKKFAGRINWLCQLNPDSGYAIKVEFRKATAGFLKKNPGLEIPELSWNSSIESEACVEETDFTKDSLMTSPIPKIEIEKIEPSKFNVPSLVPIG